LNPPAPHALIDATLARLRSPRGCRTQSASVRFTLATPWDASRPEADLTAVFEAREGRLRAFVTDRTEAAHAAAEFEAAADAAGAAIVDWQRPLALDTAIVEKPWGRECWYTGVEARGVSRVTDGRHATPLPWVLALDPAGFQGGAPLVLAKRLEPHAEPVRGDLYFEMHEAKREVYVVTAVDRRVWPDGTGAIRFGMNAALRRRYGDDARFRADYLAAVRRYEAVRRAIDAGRSDAAALAEERRLRAGMDAFTTLCELRVGDVVQVPTFFPHALQHGVRVIELQTPVYERRILSFAQSTPTQDRWDTGDVIDTLSLDAHALASIDTLADDGTVRVERIARFTDFEAYRIRLAPGAQHRLEGADTHRLCVAVDGALAVNSHTLAAEDACLLPVAFGAIDLRDASGLGATCIVAVPQR
jgi:hypothetical protein